MGAYPGGYDGGILFVVFRRKAVEVEKEIVAELNQMYFKSGLLIFIREVQLINRAFRLFKSPQPVISFPGAQGLFPEYLGIVRIQRIDGWDTALEQQGREGRNDNRLFHGSSF